MKNSPLVGVLKCELTNELFQDDWESLNRKGNRALAEGKHEVALECFNDALELDEDNHVLYSNRCVAHIKLEKWKLAVEDAENVIKLKPDWVTGHARLGAAAFGNHDFIGARKSFEKAAKIDPDNRRCRAYFPCFRTCFLVLLAAFSLYNVLRFECFSYTEQAIKCTEMALQAASMGRKNPLEEPSALEELVTFIPPILSQPCGLFNQLYELAPELANDCCFTEGTLINVNVLHYFFD